MPEDISSTGLKKAPRRTRESREVRERQILEAAINCMSRTGFHAASVVQIAQEAGLSVGVIYLYFENKEAILEAIAKRDFAEMQTFFANLEGLDAKALKETIMSEADGPISRNYERSRFSLLLEMFAEASRNPRVEAIMQDLDKRGGALGQDLVRKLNPDLKDAGEIEIRNEVVRMLMDGMLVRGLLNPNIDRQKLSVTLHHVLNYVVTAPLDMEKD